MEALGCTVEPHLLSPPLLPVVLFAPHPALGATHSSLRDNMSARILYIYIYKERWRGGGEIFRWS